MHLIGDDSWKGYPSWRRVHGEGRSARNGTRALSREQATKLVDRDLAAREKARVARGLRARALPGVENARRATVSDEAMQAREDAIAERMKAACQISDSTIRFEMSIFASVMSFAMQKRYAPVSQRYNSRPKLKVMRRDAFTLEEYRRLYRYSRDVWSKVEPREDKKDKRGSAMIAKSRWYRTVVHNFLLIMCNTGMRPGEAKSLRWRDITHGKDRDGRDIVGLFVQGKGKSRQLVALPSVGGYLERIRAMATKANRERAEKSGRKCLPDQAYEPTPLDYVFTTFDGTPATTLYKNLIDDLLTNSGLRIGPEGTIRSTYSFRHTYATMRLGEGVDVYLLAEQMGTSVKMIEDHYGHVDRMRHADRILQGGGGWALVEDEGEEKVDEPNGKAAKAAAVREKAKRPAKPQRGRRTRA